MNDESVHPTVPELTALALGDPVAETTADHGAQCTVCAVTLRRLRGAVELLADPPTESMPKAVAKRLQRAIAAEAKRRARGVQTAEQAAADAARAKAIIGSYGENLPHPGASRTFADSTPKPDDRVR